MSNGGGEAQRKKKRRTDKGSGKVLSGDHKVLWQVVSTRSPQYEPNLLSASQLPAPRRSAPTQSDSI